jgi:multidrug efflux pump subunit AcrB
VLIGILMLFGIVAKNSILLVDFAVEMMNHGMPKNEAIWEAGHKRAQPIVMTTGGDGCRHASDRDFDQRRQ